MDERSASETAAREHPGVTRIKAMYERGDFDTLDRMVKFWEALEKLGVLGDLLRRFIIWTGIIAAAPLRQRGGSRAVRRRSWRVPGPSLPQPLAPVRLWPRLLPLACLRRRGSASARGLRPCLRLARWLRRQPAPQTGRRLLRPRQALRREGPPFAAFPPRLRDRLRPPLRQSAWRFAHRLWQLLLLLRRLRPVRPIGARPLRRLASLQARPLAPGVLRRPLRRLRPSRRLAPCLRRPLPFWWAGEALGPSQGRCARLLPPFRASADRSPLAGQLGPVVAICGALEALPPRGAWRGAGAQSSPPVQALQPSEPEPGRRLRPCLARHLWPPPWDRVGKPRLRSKGAASPSRWAAASRTGLPAPRRRGRLPSASRAFGPEAAVLPGRASRRQTLHASAGRARPWRARA